MSHKSLIKSIINPVITKFGWILVSCFSKGPVKFLGYKLKKYPENCAGPFKVLFKIRFSS